MTMQTPCFSLLLAAAAFSTITSSFASHVDPEVASSAPRAFHKRSAEPETEAQAGFEDFKSNFLGLANNGFPDSYHRQLSAEPKAEAEATRHSMEIYDEFSHRRHIGAHIDFLQNW